MSSRTWGHAHKEGAEHPGGGDRKPVRQADLSESPTGDGDPLRTHSIWLQSNELLPRGQGSTAGCWRFSPGKVAAVLGDVSQQGPQTSRPASAQASG